MQRTPSQPIRHSGPRYRTPAWGERVVATKLAYRQTPSSVRPGEVRLVPDARNVNPNGQLMSRIRDSFEISALRKVISL